MNYGNKALVLVLACGMLLALPCVASAKSDETVGVREAGRAAKQAYRDYLHAKGIEKATKQYTASYGANVGRWVWLADSVGWPRSTWGQLLYVIERESGGSVHAVNPSSGCYGLLQLHPCHWSAKYGGAWIQIPRHQMWLGLKLWRESGWSPWAL
jgi:hypothetical protein